jgi:5-hydroxyisourate hydrolase/2-oxo-4-hydroxy-4-carboxy-5-ureidoimidazoline decarboxylase
VQKRYTNRPIVELEIASQEQMKITEIRLAKLFTSKKAISSTTDKNCTVAARNAEGTFKHFVICLIIFETPFQIWI